MKKSIIAIIVIIALALLLFCPIITPRYEKEEFFIPSSGALAVDYGLEAQDVNATSAIVIDANSKSLLLQKNCDEKRGMASTTKIMTALVAIENGRLDDIVEIHEKACGIEGSSVYLQIGERLTLNELLYCLMLESGNDAAVAIAIGVGNDLENFVRMMNEKATDLGLEHTHFANPHGLSDENHYTTARELAIITAEAMKHEIFREIVATKTKSVAYNGVENGRRLVNHNKMLFSYSDVVGVKTGYTDKDGKCLVSASLYGKATLITVTLRDNHPISTHNALIDRAKALYEPKCLLDVNQISQQIAVTDSTPITAINDREITLTLPKNAKIEIEIQSPNHLSLPIEKGKAVAFASITADGKEVYITHLKSTEAKDIKKKSLFNLLFGNEKKWKA